MQFYGTAPDSKRLIVRVEKTTVQMQAYFFCVCGNAWNKLSNGKISYGSHKFQLMLI